MPPFRTSRRVEFRDTDAAGIMHFSTYFQFMEVAEHEFLRSVGLSVLMHDDEGALSFPRVAAQCDYREVLRFEDVVEIALSLARRGEKSVAYRFDFSRDGKPVAQGSITCVCCRLDPRSRPRSIPIPDWIAEKLGTAAI